MKFKKLTAFATAVVCLSTMLGTVTVSHAATSNTVNITPVTDFSNYIQTYSKDTTISVMSAGGNPNAASAHKTSITNEDDYIATFDFTLKSTGDVGSWYKFLAVGVGGGNYVTMHDFQRGGSLRLTDASTVATDRLETQAGERYNYDFIADSTATGNWTSDAKYSVYIQKDGKELTFGVKRIQEKTKAETETEATSEGETSEGETTTTPATTVDTTYKGFTTKLGDGQSNFALFDKNSSYDITNLKYYTKLNDLSDYTNTHSIASRTIAQQGQDASYMINEPSITMDNDYVMEFDFAASSSGAKGDWYRDLSVAAGGGSYVHFANFGNVIKVDNESSMSWESWCSDTDKYGYKFLKDETGSGADGGIVANDINGIKYHVYMAKKGNSLTVGIKRTAPEASAETAYTGFTTTVGNGSSPMKFVDKNALYYVDNLKYYEVRDSDVTGYLEAYRKDSALVTACSSNIIDPQFAIRNANFNMENDYAMQFRYSFDSTDPKFGEDWRWLNIGVGNGNILRIRSYITGNNIKIKNDSGETVIGSYDFICDSTATTDTVFKNALGTNNYADVFVKRTGNDLTVSIKGGNNPNWSTFTTTLQDNGENQLVVCDQLDRYTVSNFIYFEKEPFFTAVDNAANYTNVDTMTSAKGTAWGQAVSLSDAEFKDGSVVALTLVGNTAMEKNSSGVYRLQFGGNYLNLNKFWNGTSDKGIIIRHSNGGAWDNTDNTAKALGYWRAENVVGNVMHIYAQLENNTFNAWVEQRDGSFVKVSAPAAESTETAINLYHGNLGATVKELKVYQKVETVKFTANSDGTTTVSAKAPAGTGTAQLITAVYDANGTTLKNVIMGTAYDLSADAETEVTAKGTIDTTAKIKVFIFDSIGGMKPLTDVFTKNF